jgi:hypothetical protein
MPMMSNLATALFVSDQAAGEAPHFGADDVENAS